MNIKEVTSDPVTSGDSGKVENAETENMKLYLKMNFNQRIERDVFFDQKNWIEKGWGEKWELAGRR